MKYLILFLLSFNCFAELQSITSSGGSKYAVMIGGEEISSHSTQHKAIESAITNLEEHCVDVCQASVTQSLELVVVVKGETPEQTPTPPEQGPVFKDVLLVWEIPTKREDGTNLLLSEIQKYEIEIDGKLEYEVLPEMSSLTISLEAGSYVIKIRTVADVSGAFSQPLELSI